MTDERKKEIKDKWLDSHPPKHAAHPIRELLEEIERLEKHIEQSRELLKHSWSNPKYIGLTYPQALSAICEDMKYERNNSRI